MDIDLHFVDDHSNFDDRIDAELDFYFDPKELLEPLKEDDLFYRHIEEY